MERQKKSDWFTRLTIEEQNRVLLKHGVDRSIGSGTLLNEDVFSVYDKEHEEFGVCEACEKMSHINTMKMDSEDGNWFCSNCMQEK